MAKAFLGLGSNVDPEQNVSRALDLLAHHPGITLTGISTLYRTPPLLPPDSDGAPADDPARVQPEFINGVLEVVTDLPPERLEDTLHEVENALGRVRSSDRYASRPMDLDLLVYLEPAGEQTRPHPDLFSRAWVALPLLELAPDLHFSEANVSLREVARAFGDPGGTPEVQLTQQLRARFLSP